MINISTVTCDVEPETTGEVEMPMLWGVLG
jgi:hypothetical protein